MNNTAWALLALLKSKDKKYYSAICKGRPKNISHKRNISQERKKERKKETNKKSNYKIKINNKKIGTQFLLDRQLPNGDWPQV